MVDNVQVTEGSGSAVAADEITDATLGLVKVQYVKLMDGTLNGSSKATVGVNGLKTESKISDGTNIVTIKPASTPPLAIDPAMVVTLSPNGINANGQNTMVNSAPVTIASDQSALAISNTPLTNFGAGKYETVAASITAQVLGATGATGDYIEGILVIPATTSPGLVTLLDGATSIPVFVGGASSVQTLHPFFIPLGMISVAGAWKLTTGASVSCIGIGKFT